MSTPIDDLLTQSLANVIEQQYLLIEKKPSTQTLKLFNDALHAAGIESPSSKESLSDLLEYRVWPRLVEHYQNKGQSTNQSAQSEVDDEFPISYDNPGDKLTWHTRNFLLMYKVIGPFNRAIVEAVNSTLPEVMKEMGDKFNQRVELVRFYNSFEFDFDGLQALEDYLLHENTFDTFPAAVAFSVPGNLKGRERYIAEVAPILEKSRADIQIFDNTPDALIWLGGFLE